MKHDEKKIEEVLDCVYNTEDNNYTQYTQLEVENAIKQYAEHIVQQERERCLKRAKDILDKEREHYGTDKHGLSYEQLEYIIKAINQDHG